MKYRGISKDYIAKIYMQTAIFLAKIKRRRDFDKEQFNCPAICSWPEGKLFCFNFSSDTRRGRGVKVWKGQTSVTKDSKYLRWKVQQWKLSVRAGIEVSSLAESNFVLSSINLEKLSYSSLPSSVPRSKLALVHTSI